MAGALMAATPITVTQTVNASQFITTQQQSRNGPGTSTFIGTVSTTGPTLVPISQFDTNTGILVGARMSVTLPYTMSVSATGTIPPSGSGRTVDVTSGITGTVTIGGTSISTTSFAASPNCNSGTALTCPATTPPAPPARLPAPPPLVNFAGTGAGSVNFSTSVNNTNTQIINGSGVTTGFASSAFVIGGATATSNV